MVADVFDEADRVEQAARSRNIAEISKKAAVEIPLEYVCRECGTETTGGRWCSKSCCDIWNRRLGL